MFKHDYAEVNGIRLHYAMNGSGKLILFVHGFPEFWYAWKDQLAEFGRDHCAVALDMRGYNLSDKPEAVEQYAIKYLTEDLRALARSLGHERFILVAHDWGGAVAWALAINHPECVEKLDHRQLAASGGVRARACREPGTAESQPVHAGVPQPQDGGDCSRPTTMRLWSAS